jgi:uroporphyrinogen III methyltransferase/synthase
MTGRVFLIGAGPGDPGLLTLRGAELLGRSDVVLYDGLINDDLLRHAPRAEQICVGKHGQSRIWRQSEVIDEIIRHAAAGKTVARLKGGDPAVFARTAEEVQAIRAANIPLEIVPGITAALAAGSFAGIPVTHRGLASAVALVTGHEEPDKPESTLDWSGLARFPGTLVIYMGVTTAGVWTRALLDAGKSPDTPAALIRRCSLPDQQTIRCRLDEVADRLTPASKFRPPVIVILGPVAKLSETTQWVEQRPLLGQTILVTRPAAQAETLAAPLRDLGARVLIQPAIEIGPPQDWKPVDQAIGSLGEYDLLVFCSHNGVGYFLSRTLQLGFDLRQLAGVQLAVVGSKTAQSLAEFHLRADIVPPDFRAQSLAAQLSPAAAGKRILVVRASRGEDVLADQLQSAGAQVTQVVAYSHRDVRQADPDILNLARAGKIDWVTITSSGTAESVANLLGDSLANTKIASLSPVTTRTLAALGYQAAAQADPYTMESLVEAIRTASQSDRSATDPAPPQQTNCTRI